MVKVAQTLHFPQHDLITSHLSTSVCGSKFTRPQNLEARLEIFCEYEQTHLQKLLMGTLSQSAVFMEIYLAPESVQIYCWGEDSLIIHQLPVNFPFYGDLWVWLKLCLCKPLYIESLMKPDGGSLSLMFLYDVILEVTWCRSAGVPFPKRSHRACPGYSPDPPASVCLL